MDKDVNNDDYQRGKNDGCSVALFGTAIGVGTIAAIDKAFAEKSPMLKFSLPTVSLCIALVGVSSILARKVYKGNKKHEYEHLR